MHNNCSTADPFQTSLFERAIAQRETLILINILHGKNKKDACLSLTLKGAPLVWFFYPWLKLADVSFHVVF
jgi:hypothetical protein